MRYTHANHTHYILTDSTFCTVCMLQAIVLLAGAHCASLEGFVFSGIQSFCEFSPLLCLFLYRCVPAAQDLPPVGHTAAG